MIFPSLHHGFLLVFVAMATCKTGRQTADEVPPHEMNIDQAEAMFRQTFLGMDLNHDHLVDFREFMEPYLVHDHNKNLAVTLEEFLQQAPGEENADILKSDFRFYDVNQDNVITVPEMQSQFRSIDTDENEEIDQSEFVAYGIQLFVDHSHPAFQPSVGK